MASKGRLSRSPANGKERGTGWGVADSTRGSLTQSRPPWAMARLAEGLLDGSISLSQKQRSISAAMSMLEPRSKPTVQAPRELLAERKETGFEAHAWPILQSRCTC